MSALPDIDLSALPADQRDAVAALLRENSALKTETADLQQIVKRLDHLVAELNHVVHGKKSEKLDADDRQLAFEGEPMDRSPRLRHRSEQPQATVRETLASETAVAEVEKRRDQQTASDDAPRRKSAPAKRNRGNLPEDLPRIERVVEPASLECPCGCGDCTRSARTAPSGSTSCPHNCAFWSPCGLGMPAAPARMASRRASHCAPLVQAQWRPRLRP